eukprot:CAMPEP_0197446038 /NCGR_PEP_ID=MMETSP1175-20131217/11097_1 /TAXON_ID=1003142 /ORGANISM="Triceratium dubium, Strain CCMP147" /LENGTH=123 /DNA_ID=CAMNT_0042977097 /DNA_START=348 /DNA_END=719 /DNA_ORIENTATION=-
MSVESESWSSFHRRHGSGAPSFAHRGCRALPSAPRSSESPAGATLRSATRCLAVLFGRSPNKNGGSKRRRRRGMMRRQSSAMAAVMGGGGAVAVDGRRRGEWNDVASQSYPRTQFNDSFVGFS